MKVSIFPENGEWLLVLNRTEPSHNRSEVDMTHAVSSFEKCWTGDGWSPTPADGQRFASKHGALAYLHNHWQRMENLATATRGRSLAIP